MVMSAKKLAIYGNECQTVSTLNRRVPTLLRFTRLKSAILVDFGTLPRQSDGVVARRRAAVLSRQGYTREASCKLQAV